MAWVGWKTMCKSKSQGGMGFRNLQAFNLALLAKQVWRILINLSSLAARILKAKYFPFGDILHANLGSRPSYTQRSIFNSLEVLRSGTRWRVGNGRLIHIWDNKWLPNPSTYKVISPPRPLVEFPMVSSLIDPVTRWWKSGAVRALFLPFEVDMILKIPLSHNLPKDKLIWLGNKRGVFTVKSAYFVATKLLDTRDEGECSSGDPNTWIWRKIQSLKLPKKVKIFSWRAYVNGLNVLANMAAKGIQTSCVCPICDEELESLIHALISCDFALSVWSLWQDCPIEVLLNAKVFNDLVFQISSSPDAKHLEFFFAISWSVWYNKNKLIHDESGLPPLQIREMAKNIVEDFQEATTLDFPPMQSPQCGQVAPPSGYFKVNVDGASSIDGSRVSGVGVIICDELGRVVAALCKALPLHYPVEWMEFFAMEQGVLLAQEMNLSNVIFESDASSVILAISQALTDGIMGHLVQGIQLTSSSFSYCLFQHMERDYNRAAHGLAQFAKCHHVSNLWKGVIPPFLVHLIQLGLR